MAGVLLVAVFWLAGCSHCRVSPPPGPEVPRPDSVLDPVVLFNRKLLRLPRRRRQEWAGHDACPTLSISRLLMTTHCVDNLQGPPGHGHVGFRAKRRWNADRSNRSMPSFAASASAGASPTHSAAMSRRLTQRRLPATRARSSGLRTIALPVMATAAVGRPKGGFRRGQVLISA